MNRVLLIPCVLLVALGVVGYWASTKGLKVVGKDRPVVLCNADELKTLDVGQMSWQSEIRTAMALWEGLTSYDRETLKPIPGVAESWNLSVDGRTYTFHLRKDARWSNGDPVVAGDFVFAWRRVFLPSTGGNYVSFFNLIEGGEEYAAAVAAGRKDADFAKVGVETPDPLTLIVHLKYPRAYFLDLCAFPTFFPLNERSMRGSLEDPADPSKGYTGTWTRSPNLVTNGPFYLKDWKFKQYLLLEPNPHYWDRGNVRCNQLVIEAIADPRAALLAYQSGTVDILTFLPQQFAQDLLKQIDEGRKDIHYRPVFGTYYYIFNCTRPPLTDKRVRRALSLAINRQKISDVVGMREKPLGLLVPPESIPGYGSPKGLGGDIAEAQRLLAEAGFAGGKGMRSLEIMYNNESIHERVAQAIGEMWEKNLGVKVTYRGLEKTGFAAERQEAHNFDVGRAGWYGDYADPTTWLNMARTGDSNNDGLYSNPAYDGLLDKAFAEPDPERRLGILSEAEGMIMEDELPFLPLYQYAEGYFFDESKIGGMMMNVRLLTELKWVYRKPE